jgi:hypothetical protein
MTEDRGQMAEDRGQMAEDRGQRTEDRSRNSKASPIFAMTAHAIPSQNNAV